MFGWGKTERFDKSKMKAALKMAITRIKMQQNKRQNQIRMMRREIAQLLQGEKYESARIKVEQVMRDEYYMEALELLSLFCDLLVSRLMLLAESQVCPPDLKEALTTLIWACPRVDGITEFSHIRKHTALKYGTEFVQLASDNAEMSVNQRVYDKLSVMVPEAYLCIQYLEGIAREFDLDWEEIERHIMSSQLVPPSGGGPVPPPCGPPIIPDVAPPGLPNPPFPPGGYPPPGHPHPTGGLSDNPYLGNARGGDQAPIDDFPKPPGYQGGEPVGGSNDFSDLEARFEALKRQ